MYKYALLFLVLSFGITSCIKDTDFDQADEIELSPVVELDFLFFTLDIDNFQENTGFEGTFTVVDTTEIRFLDGSFTQENLLSAEYFFRVTNSFPLGVDANFNFLTEENEPFYEIDFLILPGTNNNPASTEFIQTITAEEIEQLTQTNKVVVTFTLETLDENLSGVLNLQSKTTYFLKF